MIESIVRRVPLFSNLPPAEIATLAASLTEARYPAGTVLFFEGDCGDTFYIVVDGEIDILKGMGTPEELLLEIRDSGEFKEDMD